MLMYFIYVILTYIQMPFIAGKVESILTLISKFKHVSF